MYGNSRTPSKLFGICLLLACVSALPVGISALGSGTTTVNAAAAQEISGEHEWMEPYILVSAGCLLLFVAVTAWQVVPLLLARPAITVDYLAQANEAGKPVNCDPNRNAAPYYEELLAQFIPPPETLKHKFQLWPTDLSSEEFKALEAWVPGHESALSVLARAVRCPYRWYELKSTDGAMWNIPMPDLDRLRECAWGVLLLAKYKATRGDAGAGLHLLTDLHMFGVHLARSATLVEQMGGLAICGLSYDAVLTLLDHGEAEVDSLKSALHTLARQIPLIVVPRFSEGEHLYGPDCIQRLFTDDGRGNGRLIPGALYQSRKRQPGPYSRPISYPDAVRICLAHPDRQSTLRSYETGFTLARDLSSQTPWSLHVQNTSYEEQLKTPCFRNYLLHDHLTAVAHCIRIGWRTARRAMQRLPFWRSSPTRPRKAGSRNPSSNSRRKACCPACRWTRIVMLRSSTRSMEAASRSTVWARTLWTTAASPANGMTGVAATTSSGRSLLGSSNPGSAHPSCRQISASGRAETRSLPIAPAQHAT